jgi:hypothetical protein
MKKFDVTMIVGIGLIVVGGLFLLQTFGVIEGVLPAIWAFIFAASGAIFLYFFWINRQQWWALIPGFTTLGLAALILIAEYGPQDWDEWAAALFLASIALSFLVIYILNREHWWAIIPGGVLLSVAALVGLSSITSGDELIVAVFFFGIALTFGVLAFLPSPAGRMRWALIPGGVMLVMSIIFLAIAVQGFKFVWPAAIVILGLYVLYRALFRQSRV